MAPTFSLITVLVLSGLVLLASIYVEHSYSTAIRYYISSVLPLNTDAVVYDDLHDITYEGVVTSDRIEHYQNIFYAKDTSGINRFRAPLPHVPNRGSVIDATRPGAWCPQGMGDLLPFSSHIDNISENCLSLRIARPAGTQAHAKLPVMVWIFSGEYRVELSRLTMLTGEGGHALGSAYEKLYTPDGLVSQSVADDQPVIYVAMNYRVGRAYSWACPGLPLTN